MGGPATVVKQVPDIRDDVTMTSSRCQWAAEGSSRLPMVEEYSGTAECRQGCGARPCPDTALPSPNTVISSVLQRPATATNTKLDPAAAAAAVALLSRVPPLGPASRAGWGLSSWERLSGGGESTGTTGTAGWGPPPPGGPAPGTANWGTPAPPPANWGGVAGGRQGPSSSQGPPPPPATQQPPPTPANKSGAPANNGPAQGPTNGPGQAQGPGSVTASSGQEQAAGQKAAQPLTTPGQRPNTSEGGTSTAGSGGTGTGASTSTAGGTGTAPTPATPSGDSADLEKLKAMRAAITATEGWNSSQVNQDTPWDVPTSPEPSDKDTGTVVAWKLPGVNNGLDIWQTNLRNGGAPMSKPMDQQWQHSHIPQTNHGGTWGEDDDASNQGGNMWTGGGPPGPPGGPLGGPPSGPPANHWGGPGPGMWAGGPAQKKDDWGGPKPWEQSGRGPNGDGWGQKPPGPYQQHGPGGWSGDHSPPMGRRGMGFDDWGNKRGGGGWKEMQGGPVRPGMPGGPPAPHMMGRMPPGPGGPDSAHKVSRPSKEMDPWGRPPRNGWNEAPPGGWGEDKWGGGGGWGGKPKTPTMPGMPGGWAEPEMDWKGGRAGPSGPSGMHSSSKAGMFEKYRALTEQGFKPEEVEVMLRGNPLTLEDAVDQLRLAGGPGSGGDWRGAPDHPPFDQHGFAQMPPPGHIHYGGGANMQMPNTGHGGSNPTAVQQLLRQQSQQSSRFPGQQGQSSSAQGLRPLVNQIQMAVHAGHLNPAILQQPMGPQTLTLLNGLLTQIKTLDQLTRQQQHLMRGGQVMAGSHHFQQLQMEIMRVKSQIQQSQAQVFAQGESLSGGGGGGGVGALGGGGLGSPDYLSRRVSQSQIGGQQAMLLKQQLAAAGGAGPQQLYKQPQQHPSPADLHALHAGMADAPLRGEMPGTPALMSGQSRLSQWKLPTSDKPYRPEEEFSRAPGSGAKSNQSPPLSLMGDSTWSSARVGGEAGWPETNGAAVTPSVAEGKDGGWPTGSGVAHNSYDLVPEFEPGKPWRMKSPEDDPGLTPGSARGAALGLSSSSSVQQDLLSLQQAGKSSPTGNGADTFGSSTWSFNPNGSKPGSMSANGKWDSGADWSLKARGPPPGLNKSVSSGGGWGRGSGTSQYEQRSAFAPVHGVGWGAGSAWLLLRNLTAQIDGSTLKTLCMQHGPLYTFHMYLNQGVALVKYSTREEAAKAQGALNNCVLSNTTIMAEAVTNEHADQLLQQLGLPGAQPGGGYNQSPPVSSGAPPSSKPPASAAWEDMVDNLGGPNMAWSSASGGNSTLWATASMDDGAGRGPYLPDGLL